MLYFCCVKHLTRIAPTPSGFLHPGNLYNFLLTESIANQHGADMLLRIDDMDAARMRTEYVEYIFSALSAIQFTWQRGPSNVRDFAAVWSQQHRLPQYERMLNTLAERGHVYACTCSRKEIQQRGAHVYDGHCRTLNIPLDAVDVSWRVRVPEHSTVGWQDHIMGSVSVDLPASVGDFVVRRRDGLPAYQITSLCDDVAMGITIVVRGQDLKESTAMQLFLAKLLGENAFEKILWWHHPLIIDQQGEKLSKSAGNAERIHENWSRVALMDWCNSMGFHI